MKYLHTMVRVTDLDNSIAFFELLGLREVRRNDYPQGKFTLVFMAANDDMDAVAAGNAPCVELTYNWHSAEEYKGGRNFGHLAYEVDDIYALCAKLAEAGVTINRPPRDGRMAFIRTPDNISIELLQRGGALAPQEPWSSAPNIGEW